MSGAPSPESARKDRNSRTSHRSGRSLESCCFAGISQPFEKRDRTTENRGVPGSSPGLATSRTLYPAWKLDSLVGGGMEAELMPLAHETVVVSPDRVTGRLGRETPAKPRLSSPRKPSAASIETARRPFPAFSSHAETRRRPPDAVDDVPAQPVTASWRQQHVLVQVLEEEWAPCPVSLSPRTRRSPAPRDSACGSRQSASRGSGGPLGTGLTASVTE